MRGKITRLGRQQVLLKTHMITHDPPSTHLQQRKLLVGHWAIFHCLLRQERPAGQAGYAEASIESFVGHSSMVLLCPPACCVSLEQSLTQTHTHAHTRTKKQQAAFKMKGKNTKQLSAYRHCPIGNYLQPFCKLACSYCCYIEAKDLKMRPKTSKMMKLP